MNAFRVSSAVFRVIRSCGWSAGRGGLGTRFGWALTCAATVRCFRSVAGGAGGTGGAATCGAVICGAVCSSSDSHSSGMLVGQCSSGTGVGAFALFRPAFLPFEKSPPTRTAAMITIYNMSLLSMRLGVWVLPCKVGYIFLNGQGNGRIFRRMASIYTGDSCLFMLIVVWLLVHFLVFPGMKFSSHPGGTPVSPG